MRDGCGAGGGAGARRLLSCNLGSGRTGSTNSASPHVLIASRHAKVSAYGRQAPGCSLAASPSCAGTRGTGIGGSGREQRQQSATEISGQPETRRRGGASRKRTRPLTRSRPLPRTRARPRLLSKRSRPEARGGAMGAVPGTAAEPGTVSARSYGHGSVGPVSAAATATDSETLRYRILGGWCPTPHGEFCSSPGGCHEPRGCCRSQPKSLPGVCHLCIHGE
jgi:hypothetical protein